MKSQELIPFRLVGGTSLSLQLGHRSSEDIDLFTDVPYQAIDFEAIDAHLRASFDYVTKPTSGPIGMGRSYFVGLNEKAAIKLDLYYTETFLCTPLLKEDIRFATIQDIVAMKIDVVQRLGRKKDFWDLHELLDHYSIWEMLDLHKRRYPYNHDEKLIRRNFSDFSLADDDFEPNCLRGEILGNNQAGNLLGGKFYGLT
jgi:hypothetical protein